MQYDDRWSELLDTFCGSAVFFKYDRYIPVSYTHLDVYKRQPIDFVATLLEGKVKYQKLPSGNSDYIEFYDKRCV